MTPMAAQCRSQGAKEQPMTSTDGVAFDVEQGLIELPGTSVRWIWAFTCPTPKCACRVAVVLSAPGDRELLLERGRPVADAWLGHAHYGQAAQDLQDVVAFSTRPCSQR